MLPYTSWYNRAFGTSHATAPDLSKTQLQDISARPESNRSFSFLGPDMQSGYPTDGYWHPTDFTNGAGTLASYTDWARGQNCGDAKAVIKTTPGIVHRGGTPSDFVSAMSDAMASVCYRKDTTDPARCYASASATTSGMRVRIPLGDVSGTAAGSPRCA